MRGYGNVAHTETSDRWVEVPVSGYGIEVPIDPPPVSAQVAAARLAWQAERQAAAEAAAAVVAKPKRGPRSRETFSVASVSPVPARVAAAPAPAPTPPARAVVDVIEDLAPAGPVPCLAPGCSQLVTAEYVARTGQKIHAPCRDRLAAAGAGASSGSAPSRLVVEDELADLLMVDPRAVEDAIHRMITAPAHRSRRSADIGAGRRS